MENNRWKNYWIWSGDHYRTFDDIASLRHQITGAVTVWAVGEQVDGKNIYSFDNSTRQWSLVQGLATKIDVCQATSQPWHLNSNGDVLELIPGTGWVQRGWGSQQKAIDIGCGAIYSAPDYYAIFITTDQGKLMRYNGNQTWVTNAQFEATGKSAKAVDASWNVAAVVTTDGQLYFVNEYQGWAIWNNQISNVKDVSLCADPLAP
jgi:hypothetical protein